VRYETWFREITLAAANSLSERNGAQLSKRTAFYQRALCTALSAFAAPAAARPSAAALYRLFPRRRRLDIKRYLAAVQRTVFTRLIPRTGRSTQSQLRFPKTRVKRASACMRQVLIALYIKLTLFSSSFLLLLLLIERCGATQYCKCDRK
jgi:hypothetical protein